MIASALLNFSTNVTKFVDIIKDLNIEGLKNIPLVGREEYDRPWHVLDLETFLNYYNVGFYFEDVGVKPSYFELLNSLDKYIITSDAELACNRFKNGLISKTGIRSSLGSIAPIIDIVLSKRGTCIPCKILAITDSCCSDIIIEMESKYRSINKAIEELQWKGYIKSNVGKHIHGIYAKNKFYLLNSVIFAKKIDYDKLFSEGITSVSLIDIKIASEIKFKIRLVGIAEIQNNYLYIFIKPIMLPTRYLLTQSKLGTESIYVIYNNNTTNFYASSAYCLDTIYIEAITDWKTINDYNRLTYYDFIENNKLDPCYDYSKYYARFYIRFSLTDNENISDLFNYLRAMKIPVLKFYQFDKSLLSERKEKIVENSCDVVVITKEVEQGKIENIYKNINTELPLICLKSFYQIEGL